MGLVAGVVYGLTLEPSVSFWDCGEFIATSYGMQVGHPPGAPFYQLLAHCMMLLAMGNGARLAWWSNMLSAVAGAATVMFLFWTVVRLCRWCGRERRERNLHLLAGIVGAMAYLFCDTAWFSAVESEVYSLSMLLSSVVIWASLRWADEDCRHKAWRWLLLAALLAGLSVCVHLLTLLALPAVLMVFVLSKRNEWSTLLRTLPLLLLLFVIGLSPYLIIPIRANANPPINEGDPSTKERFVDYVTRKQYEHAPLLPRMWRNHPNDARYYAEWSSKGGEWEFYATYQLGYMYVRYFMWNFVGRYNDRQGFGSMQNGQLITGIPPIDKMIVGTSQKPPESLPQSGHHTYYLLPLLLGVMGLLYQREHSKRGFWAVMVLFLFGGVILSFYLNHPIYEPRERDYAYILSFYAFCVWIGLGVCSLQAWAEKSMAKPSRRPRLRQKLRYVSIIALAVPLLMACENWHDHNRSQRMLAHDVACNMLHSCDPDAMLFTLGDNDTFPLWGVQTTEEVRSDVQVLNINLMGGWHKMIETMTESHRPIYLTQYAVDRYGMLFAGRLQLEGYTYRLMDEPCDSVAQEAFCRHLTQGIAWHAMEGVYVDEIAHRMLLQYWHNVLLLAQNLLTDADTVRMVDLLQEQERQVPLSVLKEPTVAYQVADLYRQAGRQDLWQQHRTRLHAVLQKELAYYHSIPPHRQRYIDHIIAPREEVIALLAE